MIQKDDTYRFENSLKGIALNPPKTGEELSYIIQRVCYVYMGISCSPKELCETLGALELAKVRILNNTRGMGHLGEDE